MVIVSGAIGVHGIAIMSVREGLEFGTVIASDTAPLNGLVATMLAVTPEIHVLRDPTRGGLASSLNEIARRPAWASRTRSASCLCRRRPGRVRHPGHGPGLHCE
ncbi:MAG: AIR synthase-related protein [Caldilineaceae bacterium]